MEKHGRSGGSPESESSQGRLLVVIHPWEGKPHPLCSTARRNKTHMNVNCQPEMKLLSSNWLPGTQPLFPWHKKLLLGIGIGVGYKLSHDGVGKKEIKDLNWSNGIELRERDGQSVPCFVERDNRL